MELRQLRQFNVLAEEKHFGRAAERLQLSQPALSVSIGRLESSLQVRLFDRDSKGVRLTPAGEMLLAYASEVLNLAERTQRFSQALAQGRVGRLEIGFSSVMPYRGFDQVLAYCGKAHPEIEIVLREFLSHQQSELLRSGGLDAGLLIAAQPPEELESIVLTETRYVVCLPGTHPLAARASIDITELRHERFVMQSQARSPRVHELLMGFCALAGFRPRVVVESAHSQSTVSLVARGFGVGLVVDAMADLGIQGVAFVPLTRPMEAHHGYFVWNPARQAPGLLTLIEAIRRLFPQPPAEA